MKQLIISNLHLDISINIIINKPYKVVYENNLFYYIRDEINLLCSFYKNELGHWNALMNLR